MGIYFDGDMACGGAASTSVDQGCEHALLVPYIRKVLAYCYLQTVTFPPRCVSCAHEFGEGHGQDCPVGEVETHFDIEYGMVGKTDDF